MAKWFEVPVDVRRDLPVQIEIILATLCGCRALVLLKYFIAVLSRDFRSLLPNVDLYQCSSYERVDVFYLNRLCCVGLLVGVAYYLMVIFALARHLRSVLITFTLVELSVAIVCSVGIGSSTLHIVVNSLSFGATAVLGLVTTFSAYAHEKGIYAIQY